VGSELRMRNESLAHWRRREGRQREREGIKGSLSAPERGQEWGEQVGSGEAVLADHPEVSWTHKAQPGVWIWGSSLFFLVLLRALPGLQWAGQTTGQRVASMGCTGPYNAIPPGTGRTWAT
jgi:hypothetical protein